MDGRTDRYQVSA